MARVKRGVIAGRRHKKILKQGEGLLQRPPQGVRAAKQAVIKAGQYAYRDRRAKKRDFRALWITRINAAAREFGLSYSRLMAGLKAPASRSTARCSPTSRCTTSTAFGAIAEKAKSRAGREVARVRTQGVG